MGTDFHRIGASLRCKILINIVMADFNSAIIQIKCSKSDKMFEMRIQNLEFIFIPFMFAHSNVKVVNLNVIYFINGY